MPGHRTLNPQTSLPGELPNPGPDDDNKHFYYYTSIYVSSCGVVILTCLILYIYFILTLIKKSRVKKRPKILQNPGYLLPPSNPLSKVLNRHTVKFSFCCMPNIGKIISGHNKKILKQGTPPEKKMLL